MTIFSRKYANFPTGQWIFSPAVAQRIILHVWMSAICAQINLVMTYGPILTLNPVENDEQVHKKPFHFSTMLSCWWFQRRDSLQFDDGTTFPKLLFHDSFCCVFCASVALELKTRSKITSLAINLSRKEKKKGMHKLPQSVIKKRFMLRSLSKTMPLTEEKTLFLCLSLSLLLGLFF